MSSILHDVSKRLPRVVSMRRFKKWLGLGLAICLSTNPIDCCLLGFAPAGRNKSMVAASEPVELSVPLGL
ncbi:MAG: hypothetical protein ABI557_19545, partial [Aureliella sp.]